MRDEGLRGAALAEFEQTYLPMGRAAEELEADTTPSM